ncbi:fungal-specific transcription factor domain-containing protein [Colletotrichum asianum]
MIRQLIRQYLEDTPLPSFATHGMKATPSGGTLEALSSSQRDDERDNNAFGGRKRLRDNESEDEVNGGVSALNELLMHVSLADDGQPYAMLNLDDVTVNLHDEDGLQDESREVGSLKVDAAITRTWEMLVWDKLELERGPEVSQAIKQLLET